MIKQQLLVFVLRWALSSVSMWVCLSLFATIDQQANVWLFVVAGLVFSLVNSIVKPLVTTFTLPLIIVSMGIFTILINVGMVALSVWILPTVRISFFGATMSALTMSVINGLANLLLPDYNKE